MKTNQIRWEKGGCLPIPLASLWITGLCTLRCKHCYEAHSESCRKHLSKEQIFLTMERLAPYVNSFSFMGGEPTLHPDLPEICEFSKRLGKYTLLVSNGLAITEELVTKLEGKVDCVKLGMDGVSAETHDAVRGKGSFAKTLNAWRVMPLRIPTMCKFTLNAVNLRELPQIADFYRNLGAQRLVLNRWLAIGSGSSVWNRKFALSAEQIKYINKFVQEQLKPNYHIFPISRSCSLDNGCLDIPARTYYVGENGSVSPCIFSGHLAVGDIRAKELDVKALLAEVNRIRYAYTDLHQAIPKNVEVAREIKISELVMCIH